MWGPADKWAGPRKSLDAVFPWVILILVTACSRMLRYIALMFVKFFSHFLFRVRLVERGSPHSLPLMESGKVMKWAILGSGPMFFLEQARFCEVEAGEVPSKSGGMITLAGP